MTDGDHLAVTRRGLLAGGAAGAAGLATGVPAGEARRRRASKTRRRSRRAQVAIVGAGLAGLTAARDLAAAGRSVVVLEAERRVGGRTLNHRLDGGEVTELGGQWVGPTQVSDAGAARVCFDNSPPDGAPGVLMGFVAGHEARKWTRRPAAARRAEILRNFAGFFGDRALRPRDYVEMDWAAQPWTRGAVAFTAPGVLLDYGSAIRAPIGRIHWASSETSTYWNGYMDGAVRSGERAAQEVLAAQ